MRVTHLILGEHASLLTAFSYLEQASAERELSAFVEAARLVEALMMHHAVNEDQLLFDAMPGQGPGIDDALRAMRRDHDNIREQFASLYECESLSEMRGRLVKLLEYCRDHFALEERVMIPLAETALGDARLRKLGDQWARRRQISRATL